MHPEPHRQQYEGWVHQHADGLYRLALRLTGQTHVAEELVQETFYHAWRSSDSLRDVEHARGWLFRILRHRYAHWVRGRQRRSNTVAMTEPESIPAETRAPGEALELDDFLQQALDHLEDRYKVPLLMVFLDGMTCREAAAALDLPLGTVLSRIHRARQSVRERLAAAQRRESRPGIRIVGTESDDCHMFPATDPGDEAPNRQLGGGL